jgi:RNA polymerase sigma-70 factor (ECF subfamily)
MAATSLASTRDREFLDAARRGDEDAIRHIVEAHRAELHAHCYRMLGSVQDAEDALQDTLLRAWRGLPQFAGRSSLRTWLHRVATNVCLEAIARRPRRALPMDYGPASESQVDPALPLAESAWIEPYPDEALGLGGYAAPAARYEQREAVELAFIAALQHLPATQRAVLILREVLGFSAREVSESLETTVASVNSALQRARKTVAARLPDRTQQETLRAIGDNRVREIVQAYVDAWSKRDVDALRALLAEDVIFSMPPWASWWRGRETIASFASVEDCGEWCAVPTRANGQPALACYHLDAETGRWVAWALEVIAFEGQRIKEITAFFTPEAFPRFGLASALRRGTSAET